MLTVAEANATAAGLGGRYRPRPGSAFEVDWGSDLDLVLLLSFLHHFDRDGCVALLAKARGACPKGAEWSAEYVVNEDRISPLSPAMFAFIMLGSTPSGDAYTRASSRRWAAPQASPARASGRCRRHRIHS